MKKLLLALLLSGAVNTIHAQIKDALWWSVGGEYRTGSYNQINKFFPEDNYTVFNPLSFRLDFINQNGMSYLVDATGLVNYYWPNETHNTATNATFNYAWDKTNIRFGLFKLLGDENKNTRIALGGQVLHRTYGISMEMNGRNLKPVVKGDFAAFQAGPLSARRRFGFGPNIQVVNNLKDILLTRAGIFADYEPGTRSNAINIYPEANFVLHYKSIGFSTSLAYRYSFISGDPNSGVYYDVPVKNVSTSAFIYSVGLCYDLDKHL